MGLLAGIGALFGRRSRKTPERVVEPPQARESVVEERVPARKTKRRLVIGFDFGTSCTKVVVGDPITGSRYLVPARRPAVEAAEYLHSATLFEDAAGAFSLLDRPGAKAHRNLKLRFLEDLEPSSSASERAPCDENNLLHVVLYFAAVFQHVRGWFLDRFGPEYGDVEFDWWINVGLPSRDIRCEKQVRGYERAARAGWTLSFADQFTLENAKRIVHSVGADQLGDRIHAYPEVAAELETFRQSDFSEFGRFLLVDVGAGTLDISTFGLVDGGDDNDRINFHAAEVAHLGAYLLHSARVESLARTGHECSEQFSLDELDYQIPDLAVELGTGKLAQDQALRECLKEADAKFCKRCVDEVARVVMATHVHFNRIGDQSARAFRVEIPTFLCGGGSRLPFYENVVAETSRRLGGYLAWAPNAQGMTRRRLVEPRGLVAPHLNPNDFDRFAVAFGLSFPYRDLPEIRVSRLEDELRQAEADPSQWADDVSASEFSKQILEELLYPDPDVEDVSQYTEVLLKRPVTVRALRMTPQYDWVDTTTICRRFAKLSGETITEDSPLSEEHVISEFRTNRHRVRFY